MIVDVGFRDKKLATAHLDGDTVRWEGDYRAVSHVVSYYIQDGLAGAALLQRLVKRLRGQWWAAQREEPEFARWVEETGPRGARRWRNADDPSAKPVYKEPTDPVSQVDSSSPSSTPAAVPIHHQFIDHYLDQSTVQEPLKSDYRQTMRATMDAMTPLARTLMMKGATAGIHFHPTFKAMQDEFRTLCGKPNGRSNGAFVTMRGSDVAFLVLDGDRKVIRANTDVRAGIYAHEVWHSVDKRHVFSSDPAWRNAWNREIRTFSKEPTLTQYATTTSAEGFAEFGRAVLTMPEVAKQFPLCLAFFRSKGLA